MYAQLGELLPEIVCQPLAHRIFRGKMPGVDEVQLLCVQKIVVTKIGSDKSIAAQCNSLCDIFAAGAAAHRHTVYGSAAICIAQPIAS